MNKEDFILLVRGSTSKAELLRKMGKASRTTLIQYEKKFGLKIIKSSTLDVEEI